MIAGVHSTVTGILGQYCLSGNVLEDALGLPNPNPSPSPSRRRCAPVAGFGLG